MLYQGGEIVIYSQLDTFKYVETDWSVPVGTADLQFNKALGRKLKNARELCALTQAQVAKYLGVKCKVVSYYENGLRPISLAKLTALSDLYGSDIGYFLTEETEKEPVFLSFRAANIKGEDRVNACDNLPGRLNRLW